MARFYPLTNEAAGHPLRRSLPPPLCEARALPADRLREDIGFFLTSFVCGFIIFWNFIF